MTKKIEEARNKYMTKSFTKLLVMAACLLCSVNALAYDFEVDGIYYNIVSAEELTCEVTSQSSSDYYSYSGDISIPENVEYGNKDYKVVSIGEHTFSACIGLTSVNLPSSLVSIGEYAFYQCGLTSVNLPSSLVSIGEYAFFACSGLKSVNLPSSLVSIGEYAFFMCSKLTSVNLPSSLVSIGRCAFSECSNLTSVNLPSSLVSIGSYAFSECSNLEVTSLTISNNNTIGVAAFTGCKSIASAIIGPDVTSLGTFGAIPAKVIWLPKTPPKGCNNHSWGKVNYVANDSYSFSSGERYIYDYLSSMFEVDGVVYVPVNPGERTCDIIDCSYSNETNKINLKRTVNYKGVNMEVQNIRPYSFYNNDFINELTIDGFEGEIPKYAFYSCDKIPEVNITNTITSIGESAFGECSRLKDVTIADRNTDLQLGKHVFFSCPLDNVYIDGKIVYNTSSDDGYSPFYNNTSLRTVTITDKETTIYDYEFYGCTGLKNVKIGDGVTSFGKYAFSGCSSLETFEFGAHVETIGEETFSDCRAMTKITSHTLVPPTCGIESLDDINKWECTLYVPETAVDAYKAADQWKNFFVVESFDHTGIDTDPVENTCKTEVARYGPKRQKSIRNIQGDCHNTLYRRHKDKKRW